MNRTCVRRRVRLEIRHRTTELKSYRLSKRPAEAWSVSDFNEVRSWLARDGGDYSVRPLYGGILRVGR